MTKPPESAVASASGGSLGEKIAASLREIQEKEIAGDFKAAFLVCQSVVIDNFENLSPNVLAELYLTMARLSEKMQRPDRAQKYRQKAEALQTSKEKAVSDPSVVERLHHMSSSASFLEPTATPESRDASPTFQDSERTPAQATNGEALPSRLVLAGFWPRAVATLVDVVIVIGVMLVSMEVAALLMHKSLASLLDFFGQQIGTMMLLVVLFVLFLLGYQTLFTVYGGQTAGKMLFRLRVVRGDGRGLSRKDALRRLAGLILCWISGLAGFLWIGFDERRQGWHDKLARTLVIRMPGPSSDGEK